MIPSSKGRTRIPLEVILPIFCAVLYVRQSVTIWTTADKNSKLESCSPYKTCKHLQAFAVIFPQQNFFSANMQ